MAILGILGSGGGTTAKYEATEVIAGNVPGVEIGCAIWSRQKDVKGPSRMRELDVPVEIIRLRDFPDDPLGFGERMLEVLRKYGVTHVLQNGWLPHTPSNVVQEYEGRIFNQHPGKTPEFGGDKMAGETVHAVVLRFRKLLLDATGRPFDKTMVVAHRVINELDRGPIVKSGYVPIFDGDTVETLQDRALAVEWRVQFDLIRDIANGTVREEKHPSLVLPGDEYLLKRAYNEILAEMQAA